MHLDPMMVPITGAIFLVLFLGLLLRQLGQPAAIGYILGGVILGQHGLGVFTNDESLSRRGAIGLLLLLFFVGMELSPREFLRRWKIPVFGTLLQILGSVLFVGVIGYLFDWPFPRILLLGFVISLSSTAVVIKLLQDRNELNSALGQGVVGVLIVQDIAVIGMLLCISALSGDDLGLAGLISEGVGALFCVGVVVVLVKREGQFSFSFLTRFVNDAESQVFLALLICFGAALLVGFTGLPVALGAFLGGMLVHSARETHWVHERLEPFRIVFVATFFVSVGLLLDLQFLMDNWQEVGILLMGVLFTNTFINALIFRGLGDTWSGSIYSGALLSQIGEFSFVLVGIGLNKKFIAEFAYQSTLAVIVLSLILSPLWIMFIRRLTVGRNPKIAA
ncbi:MAG: cation:proton antiporter [Planctomycetota bacterium]|nr:cation:proton antiporter [Planctomycetota bacterium]